MKLLAASVLLLAALAMASAQTEGDRKAFNEWKNVHGKTYESLEDSARFAIWKENKAFIMDQNLVQKDYILAMNEFGALTNEEFADRYMSFMPLPGKLAIREELSTNDLPEEVNWEALDRVSAMSVDAIDKTKNIGHPNLKAIASAVAIAEKNTAEILSDKQLEQCTTPAYASKFLTSVPICTEEEYDRVQMEEGRCEPSSCKVAVTVSSLLKVPDSELYLQAAVAQGPVAVNIDGSGREVQFYASGKLAKNASFKQITVGLLLVGYTNELWQLHTPFGQTWGMEGRLNIKRGMAHKTGITKLATIPVGANIVHL